jgi:hypothetical protein
MYHKDAYIPDTVTIYSRVQRFHTLSSRVSKIRPYLSEKWFITRSSCSEAAQIFHSPDIPTSTV